MNVEQGSPIDTVETTDAGSEIAGDDTDAALVSQSSARTAARNGIGRGIRRCLAHWRSILAAALVVASVGTAAGVFFVQYRSDQKVNDAAARQAIQAGSDGAAALLSYSYDNLDRDFANTRSRLTGNFLAYYSKFSEQIGAGALQGQLTSTAKVIRAAISDLHPDSAMVLVFVNQSTKSKLKPDPIETHRGILVTLKKVNSSWLIANFDPLE